MGINEEEAEEVCQESSDARDPVQKVARISLRLQIDVIAAGARVMSPRPTFCLH